MFRYLTFIFTMVITCVFADKISVHPEDIYLESSQILIRTENGWEPVSKIVVEPSGLVAYRAKYDLGIAWYCECGTWNGGSEDRCYWCEKRR